ncbi:MAG: hypothetical protein ACXWZR_00820 [Mycobacterium sp.]
MSQNFAEFAESHRGVYATDISYAIAYDDEAWVEADGRVAARVWITTSRPDEEPTRVWETTWRVGATSPHWPPTEPGRFIPTGAG